MINYDRLNYIKKQKQYLKVARAAFIRYLNENTYLSYNNPKNKPFYYVLDDKLILANGLNVYVFNNDELLIKKQKNKLDNSFEERALSSYHEFQRYEEMVQYPVLDIDIDESGIVMLGSNNEVQDFYINNFSLAKKLLGENTKYYLCRKNDACMAKSEKGKGLILGIDKRFYY